MDLGRTLSRIRGEPFADRGDSSRSSCVSTASVVTRPLGQDGRYPTTGNIFCISAVRFNEGPNFVLGQYGSNLAPVNLLLTTNYDDVARANVRFLATFQFTALANPAIKNVFIYDSSCVNNMN